MKYTILFVVSFLLFVTLVGGCINVTVNKVEKATTQPTEKTTPAN